MRKLHLALLGASMLLNEAASAQQAPVGPVANPRVIMLRLFVSDLARGENFYHQVFGAAAVQRMGDNVRILTFPGAAPPGIIMIKTDDKVKMNGSFVIQVPDLEAALTHAAANGGKVQTTRFEQGVQGMPAQSRHVFDPDGNDIEVLQIGPPPAAK